MRFQKKYFLIAIALFIVECLIAAFLQDRFIRPYVGDFLVVIFLYCLIKSFFDIPDVPLAISVLAFAYIFEALQYFSFIDYVGLRHSKLANLVLGNHFEWIDIVAYTAGITVVLRCEKLRRPYAR